MIGPQLGTSKAVVLGTDFSRPADNALSWALTIGRAHQVVVHLVHAVARNLPFVDRLESYARLGEIPIGFEQERLLALADKLQSPDQPLECHLEFSRPSEAIIRVAKRVNAGLIVLGTRGEGGFRQLRIGSTAERVTQRARCPVLTVSPECKDGSNQPHRVLVATDFSPEADAALREAEVIFRLDARSAELLLLTVLHTPDGLETNANVNTMWRSYVAECRELLGERLELLKASIETTGLRTEILLREGIPADQIIRTARDEEVDLIAMGSRGAFAASRALLGSVSKRVMQTAPCPTLTVPSTWSRSAS